MLRAVGRGLVRELWDELDVAVIPLLPWDLYDGAASRRAKCDEEPIASMPSKVPYAIKSDQRTSFANAGNVSAPAQLTTSNQLGVMACETAHCHPLIPCRQVFGSDPDIWRTS